jgi:hypothetical protein
LIKMDLSRSLCAWSFCCCVFSCLSTSFFCRCQIARAIGHICVEPRHIYILLIHLSIITARLSNLEVYCRLFFSTLDIIRSNLVMCCC